MFTVHVSTVGKSAEPIFRGFRAHTVDHQILLFSKETLPVARKIMEQIHAISDSKICDMVEVNAFDTSDIVSKIIRQRSQFKESEFYVNITGGTNIMASSALVACFIIGGHAYYMKETKGAETKSLEDSIVRIPVPKVPLDGIDKIQRRILKSVLEQGGELPKANLSLSQELEETPQLISYHLRQLKRKQLVNLFSVGREKTVTLTDSGRLYAQIL